MMPDDNEPDMSPMSTQEDNSANGDGEADMSPMPEEAHDPQHPALTRPATKPNSTLSTLGAGSPYINRNK